MESRKFPYSFDSISLSYSKNFSKLEKVCEKIYDPYEFKEFVKYKKEFFMKNKNLFIYISQNKWYVCQNFYLPTTYLMDRKNRKSIELVHKEWAKIYEILVEFKLKSIHDGEGKLQSIHLEEEYGSVVGAVNHYLHSNFDKVFVEMEILNLFSHSLHICRLSGTGLPLKPTRIMKRIPLDH